MLPTVAELREQAGGLNNLTDEQVAGLIFETYGPMYGAKSFEEFAPQIGYEPNWDLGRGFQMAGRQIVGGGLRLGAKAAESANAPGVGRWLDEAADNQFNRSRQLSREHDDITNVGSVGEAIDWAQQGLGQLGAYALPSVVGGGVGGAAAARGLTGLAARQAAVRGAAAGSAALNYPVQTGLMYEDLREQGIDDLGRAATYAVPATALDLLGEVGAVSRVLTRPATGGLRRRVATEVGRGVAAEVPTELGQTAIERYSAYKDLTGDEALNEYINAAALAGLGGGGRGAVAGLIPRRSEEQAPPTFGDARSDTQPRLEGPGQGALFDADQPLPPASFSRPEANPAVEQEIRSLLAERGQMQSGMRAAEQAGNAQQFYTFADAVGQIDARLGQLSGAMSQMQGREDAAMRGQLGLFGAAGRVPTLDREYDLLSQAADDIGATRQLIERASEDQFMRSQVGRVPPGSQLGLFGPATPPQFGPAPAAPEGAVAQAIDPRQGRLEFDPRALPYDPNVPSGPGGTVNPGPIFVTPQGEATWEEDTLFDRRYAPQDYVPPAPIGVENQTDMFGGAAPTPAPVATPGPQVAQADPRQRAMFDQRGQPTYDAETQAQDDQIADQAAAYFSVKRTAKRDPYLAELGRMVFDGEITDDDAAPVAASLGGNKYGQADKGMAELRAQIAEAKAAEAVQAAAAARAEAEAKAKPKRAPKAAAPPQEAPAPVPAKPAKPAPAPTADAFDAQFEDYSVARKMKYGRDGNSEVPDGWMVERYGREVEWYPTKKQALAAAEEFRKLAAEARAKRPAADELAAVRADVDRELTKPAPAPKPERMSDEELEARQGEIDQIVTDNTRMRVEGKLDDLQLDPDAKKSKVVAYARKLREEGVLTDANVAEVERRSKDRDMGVDDLVEEIRTTVRVRNDESFGRTPAEPKREAPTPQRADPDDIVADMNGRDNRSPAQRWNDEALDDDPKFKDLPAELQRQWKDAVEDAYATGETQTRIIGVYKQRQRVAAQDARAEAEDQGDGPVEPMIGDEPVTENARRSVQMAVDQQAEYGGLDDALDSYFDNLRDTMSEYGITDPIWVAEAEDAFNKAAIEARKAAGEAMPKSGQAAWNTQRRQKEQRAKREARKAGQAAAGTLTPKATTSLRKANTLMARLINTNAGTTAYFIALRDVVLARESDKVDPEAMTVLDKALSLVPAEDAATARAEVGRSLQRPLRTSSYVTRTFKNAAVIEDAAPAPQGERLTTVPAAAVIDALPSNPDNWANSEVELPGGPGEGVWTMAMPRGKLATDIAKAISAVLATPAGRLLRHGADHARAVLVGDQDGGSEHGSYWPGYRVVTVNLMRSANDVVQNLRYTLVHELTHAADNAAAKGRHEYASKNQNSPTLVELEVDDGGMSGRVQVRGAVANEVIRQVLVGGDPEMRRMFAYVLDPLDRVLDIEPKTKKQIDDAQHAARHATVELTPRLMELYVANPTLMRARLPKAFAFAQRLANARTIAEVQEVFYADPTQDQTQPAGTTQGRAAARAAGDVRRGADAQDRNGDTGVRAADGAVEARQEAGPANQAQQGPARDGGLTAAFRRWFGDSKVVDESGKPLVVYHGTAADLTEFSSPDSRGEGYQAGIYFTTSTDLASVYGRGGAVYPVYLSIKNPLDLTTSTNLDGWVGRLMRIVAPRIREKLQSENDLKASTFQTLITRAERERLIAAGYDGIKGEGGVWIAFHPNQIKSAIGNRGTFDASANVSRTAAPVTPETLIEDQPRSFQVPETVPARNIKQRIADFVTDRKASGLGLGLLTLRQMGEIYKSRPAVRRFVDLTNKMITRARQLQGETFKIDTKWRALDDAVSLSLQRLMVDVTLAGVHPDVPVDHKSNEHLTDKQKALHPELSKRYRELVQKDARAAEVYAEAKAKMRADWDERGRLLRQAVINAYKPSLGPYAERGADIAKPDRDAFVKTLPGRSARAEMRQLWEDLDDHSARVNSIPGPYFPLVRFGRHVVTVKSARYIELSDQLTDARDVLREAMNTVEDQPSPEEKEAIDEARAEVRRLTQAIEVVKENEGDYLVEFYEKKSEANNRAEQLRAAAAAQGRAELTVAVRMREEYARQLDSASPMFMKRLEDAIKSNLPTKDATAVERAVRDLIIQSMPERSALKSELRRLNVKGAQAAQMRRAFAAASIRNSWHLSRLEYGAELNETLTELRTGDDDTNKLIGDELAKRYVQSMTFETSSEFFNKVGQLSYVTYLGMSPSFLLMNMAQPWIVSAPVMASRHGIGASAKQVGAASMEVGRAMRASFRQERDEAGSALKAARFELDLKQFGNQQERAMLEDLFDQGIIDITFEHDVGAVASGKAESWWDKSVELISLPAHHTEVINRVATALAAYRLERAKGTPDAAARAYAERIVHETHLDYTPENAPRLFNQFGSLGRLVLQFKKYGQGMMYLLAKNLSQAVKGDPEAAKTLGYVLGMQLSVAGLAGLPGAWIVGMAASALAALSEDDDEPDFKLMFENALRDVLGDTVADSLIKGLPAGVAGVNVSNRIGMGDLGNPTAFVRDGVEGREWLAYTVLSMLGPAASMFGNWAEAGMLAADDPIKAAGTALPKVIADGLKAYDAATGGVRTRSGNVLIPAEEFTGWQTAVRGLGFQPTELTNMYERRAAFERAKQNRNEARNRLIRKYVEAKAGGGDVAAIQEKITGFNERHPDARITYSTLRKSEVSRRQYQNELVDGVRVTKRDRELAERMGIGQ